MSMEHKAFLFDSRKFHSEIEDILTKCCSINGKTYAIEYINAHYYDLKSPYTGEQLDSEWLAEIETGNIQEYLDFILTACYDPNEDIGLEYSWEPLIEAITQINISSNSEQWILGEPIVCNGLTVDPGAIGLGIIEAEDVADIKNVLISSKLRLQQIKPENENIYNLTKADVIDAYDDLLNIYKLAEEKTLGIMMTF